MGPWARALGPRLGPWARARARAHKMSILSTFAFLQKRRASSVRSFWRRFRAEISHMSPKTADFVFLIKSLIFAPVIGHLTSTLGILEVDPGPVIYF